MTKAVFYLESIDYLKRGPAWIAIVVVLVALGYAGWNGSQWQENRAESMQRYASEKLADLAEWRSQLVAIEEENRELSPFEGNPMSISFPAVLTPSALGDFAVGHNDLQPQVADISPWRNAVSMFGRYQFDNPTTLAVSRFDVAFVVVVLMPILMIAVSFDSLAADRARGTLPLVMSFPLRATKLVWIRLILRNTLVWLFAGVAMTILLLVNDSGGGQRISLFAVWMLVSTAYAWFWLSLIALCVAINRSVTGAAATLVAFWAVFVLAAPAAIATTSESLYPTPSRLDYLSEIRKAQGETNRELDRLTSGFLMDHPDITVSDAQVPAYFRGAWLSNDAIRSRTATILEDYDQAWEHRQRIVGVAQFLSPSVIVQRQLHAVAGADLERQHRFQRQARGALYSLSAAVGPAVVSRNRISTDEFDQLAPFVFEDRRASVLFAGSIPSLAYLMILALILAGFAHRKLAAYQVSGK